MFGRRNTSSPAAAAAATAAAPPAAGRDDLGHDELNDGFGGAEQLWQPTLAPGAAKKRNVESLLLERGQVTEEQLDQARTVAAQTPGKSLTQILLTMNAASEAHVLEALADTLGLGFEQPDRSQVDQAAYEMLPVEFIRKHGVLPLRFDERHLVVGMTDPANVFLIDEIKRKTKRDVRAVVTTMAAINRVVEKMASGSADVKVDEIIKDMADDDVQVVKESSHDDVTDLEKMGSESPVIRFVNYLIFDAIKQGASDIHIEPKEKALKVRYRIDGILFEAMNPPHTMHPAICSRLKIMANLDISERRLPQDGRIRAMVHGRKIDLRMSTLPTAAGEKVVMRILDNRSINVALEDLGFSENALTIWKGQVEMPHGILLVTGPTGSGKTTTLYSSLRCMDGNRLNISTVEAASCW